MTGSETAKSGFHYETLLAEAISNTETDLSRSVLLKLGLVLSDIKNVKVEVPRSRYKTDLVIAITLQDDSIVTKKLSIKKSQANFNQLDRRSSEKMKKEFSLTEDEFRLLKFFCGDSKPPEYSESKTKSHKRMFITEFTEIDQKVLLEMFEKIKIAYITSAFKGNRPEHEPDYMVTISTKKGDNTLSLDMIHISKMEDAINTYLGDASVSISKKGSIKIGELTVQRKGGDGGKESANDIQVKVRPSLILEKKKISKQDTSLTINEITNMIT